MPLPTSKTGKVTKQEFFDHAVEINRVAGAVNAPLPFLSRTASYTLAEEVLGSSNVRLNFATDGTLLVPDDSMYNFPLGTVVSFSSAGVGKVTVQSASSTSSTTVGVRATRLYVQSAATISTYPVPMPSGIVNGDTVCVTFSLATSASGANWPTFPSAFTKLEQLRVPSGTQQQTFVARNVVATTFAADTTFDFTSGHTNTPIVAIVHVYSGADPINPVDGYVISTASTSTAPAYSTKNPNALEISIKNSSTGATKTLASYLPPNPPLSVIQAGDSNSTDANSQLAVAVGPSVTSPIGTVFGSRAWSPHVYGGASTLALRPSNTPTVKINSYGGLRTLAGQYTSGSLIKVGPNEWDLDGFLV